MIRIADELNEKKELITFHSTKCAEMYNVIASRDFTGGAAGGQMLGPGLYQNYFLRQAKKHKYGHEIFMAKCLNYDKYLIINAVMYKYITGKAVRQDDSSWIKEQFDRNGITTGTFTYKAPFMPPEKMSVYNDLVKKITRGDNPSSYNWPWWHKIKAAGFRGLIYTGGWDNESIVSWYVDDIIPLGISTDDAKSWKKPHDALKELMDKEDHVAMRDANLASESEYRRAMQRAYDMQLRAQQSNWTEDQLVRHIRAQITRMNKSDQYKQHIRKDAFLTVFPNLADKID